jgi:drug/metabolite transporter (DMT)-like permease
MQPVPLEYLSILLSLAASLSWGFSDFAGGLASRRAGVYQVVIISEVIGLALLTPMPFIFAEALPDARTIVLCALAGVLGMVGILVLYNALAVGEMSIAAPVSALLAAVVPALVGGFLDGFAGWSTLAGLLLALAAIWLISGGGGDLSLVRQHVKGLILPILAGLAFGTYFVMLHIASQEVTFWPLVLTRLASGCVLITYILLRRLSRPVPRAAWWLICVVGVLDVVANLMFILAGQAGRLDVAAVISSLYPAATVALAWLVLHERISRLQIVGIAAALGAIILIAS